MTVFDINTTSRKRRRQRQQQHRQTKPQRYPAADDEDNVTIPFIKFQLPSTTTSSLRPLTVLVVTVVVIIACTSCTLEVCHGFTPIQHNTGNGRILQNQHQHYPQWRPMLIRRKRVQDELTWRLWETPPPRRPISSESLFANSNPSSTSATTTTTKKKKKKNKYAKFSKVEQIDKDPFEALVEESEQKLKSIQEEKQVDPIQRQQQAIIKQGGKILTQEEQNMMRIEYPNTTEIDPYDATSFGYMEIGTVVGPHGVHGWTKVQGMTDYPERLTRAGMVLHLKPPRRRAPRKVTLASGKQIEPNMFLIQLQGIYNRTSASKLKGSTIYYATQQDTIINKDEEMLLSDLVGLHVYKTTRTDDEDDKNNNSTHDLVGEVQGVVLADEMCAIPGLLHDQLEIQLTEKEEEQSGRGDDSGQRRRRRRRTPPKLVLIPMVPEIVTKVDLEQKMILIDPPSGLLDLTYVREEKVQIKGLLAPASDD